MEQVWELFREAVSAEYAERRQALLEEADIQMDELCGCLDPEAEVKVGKQLLTREELRSELEAVSGTLETSDQAAGSPADLTLTKAGADALAFLIRTENRNTSAVRPVRLRVPLHRARRPPATHAREKPALRLCAASTRNSWRPKWAGGPRGRKSCWIKRCLHRCSHRPAMRAGGTVLQRFPHFWDRLEQLPWLLISYCGSCFGS